MPFLFFIYLKKIANIRKYRKNDEIFNIMNSVNCTVLLRFRGILIKIKLRGILIKIKLAREVQI